MTWHIIDVDGVHDERIRRSGKQLLKNGRFVCNVLHGKLLGKFITYSWQFWNYYFTFSHGSFITKSMTF